MKRNTILILSAVAILLLAIRGLYVYAGRADREREWFLKNLNYEFSAKVDSIGTRGNAGRYFIFFRETTGHFDPNQEVRLDNKLKHRHMRLFTPRGDYFFVAVRDTGVHRGDSLVVSSSRNSMDVFHHGKPSAKMKLDGFAYGKPWR